MSRPVWSGAINFGLVNIPVDLIMAVHEKSVHFHMLNKDGTCRLRHKLYCPATGKEYDFSQTARGIEVGPEDYVLVDQKEIDRLKPEKGRALEIVQFVDIAAIDPVYFDRVYYLQPGKEAGKAYKLLLESLSKSGKCAIARFVMREREYLCMIRPGKDVLVLHTLHYADEVDAISESTLSALDKSKTSAAELRMAGELIKAMTTPLHLSAFKDEFRDKLRELIDAKVKGKEIARPEYDEKPIPRNINLMEALKRSLESKPAHHEGGSAHRRSA